MKLYCLSKSGKNISSTEAKKDPIHLFTQFFIHKDERRVKEMRLCLSKNQENPDIYKIHLLGERIYTSGELGLKTMNKIVQTDIKHRLKFSDVFSYIRHNNIQGYHVLVNSDICFASDALTNLRKTDIHVDKQMFALLRYEYNAEQPTSSTIFGPRYDSQDTWIFHSAHPIPQGAEKAFSFEFGKPGCDNKMIYLVSILGYEAINDPLFIKTYHVHQSQIRNYTANDSLSPPWSILVPHGYDVRTIPNSMGYNMTQIADSTRGFQEQQFSDNSLLRDFIGDRIKNGRPFFIPSIEPLENNLAIYSRLMKDHSSDPAMHERLSALVKEYLGQIPTDSTHKIDVNIFSTEYLNSLEDGDMICAPAVQDVCIASMSYSYQWARSIYQQKKWIWSNALEVYHYLYSSPWTTSLAGKRILIISTVDEEFMTKQISVRDRIYTHRDLFPGCEFQVLQYTCYKDCVDALTPDSFDIALVDAGYETNLVSRYVYKTCGKSAISCGSILQQFFGLFDQEFMKNRPDILRLYLNGSWKRINS
jgi:hypothetical protein